MKRVGFFLWTTLLFSCYSGFSAPESDKDYRQEMVRLVIDISDYARWRNPGFIVIPQNGQELISDGGQDYLDSIDGTGREDLNYGYSGDNRPTPANAKEYMLALCRKFSDRGKTVLVTDYCRTGSKADLAYEANEQEGFLSFAAPDRDLGVIPAYPSAPRHRNGRNITVLSEAENFLYLINDENYQEKKDFLDDAAKTDYDVLIIDLCFHEGFWTAEEIESLKKKHNGGSRLVLAYMSIGEAEDYRWYWQDGWTAVPPSWLEEENPDWKGNFKVRYWDGNWRALLYGSEGSYLDRILAASFDGVYLDIIDGFEYFENRW